VSDSARLEANETSREPAQPPPPTGQRRLRIVMVSPRHPPFVGGVELHVGEVARRLAARGVEVTIFTTDVTRALLPDEEIDGVRVRRFPAWPANRDYYFAPHLYAAIVKGDWDVLHVQSYQTFVAPLAMLAAVRSRLPYVVTFHEGGHSSRVRHIFRPAQLGLLRPLLTRAGRLIVLTQFELGSYSRRLDLPRTRFAVIPNGADLPASSLSETEREQALIASIGRLERYKGHQRVIAALPHMRERRPDVTLWIAGSGPYEASLRRLAEELGVSDRVEIRSVPIEEREQMATELSRVKVVASLSEFESQGISALEALGQGCRLVVADAPGLRLFAEEGLARMVSLKISPEHLAEVLLDEIDQPAVHGRPSLPTWDDCADALLDVYQSVLRGRMAS
jgi:glycogen synthase